MPSTAISLADALIAQIEGCRLPPYRDQGGVWTIGYGSTYLADGSRVTGSTPPLTQAEADALLNAGLARVEIGVGDAVHVEMTDHQRAAVYSFAFNVGVHAFAASSLCRAINAGEPSVAAEDFAHWIYYTDPKTHRLLVSQGLKRRRILERACFLGDVMPKRASPVEATDQLNAGELAKISAA